MKRLAAGARRYRVSPAGSDDIGRVLTRMGPAFAWSPATSPEILAPGGLDGCEVLFLNCNGVQSSPALVRRVASFVSEGGAIYASDLTDSFLKAAFPRRMLTTRTGVPGAASCRVVDGGLRDSIGSRLEVTFDLPGWAQVHWTAPDVDVFVRASSILPRPLVLGFRWGEGYVVYTSFHNHAQSTQMEDALLRFLVLRPVMSRSVQQAQEEATADGALLDKAMVIQADAGAPTAALTHEVGKAEMVRWVVGWKDDAQVRLDVFSPEGHLEARHVADAPPLVLDHAATLPGTWRAQATVLRAPWTGFPVVLTVASVPGMGRPSFRVPEPEDDLDVGDGWEGVIEVDAEAAVDVGEPGEEDILIGVAKTTGLHLELFRALEGGTRFARDSTEGRTLWNTAVLEVPDLFPGVTEDAPLPLLRIERLTEGWNLTILHPAHVRPVQGDRLEEMLPLEARHPLAGEQTFYVAVGSHRCLVRTREV